VHVDKLEMDRRYAARPAVAVGDDGRVFVTKGTYVVIELDAGAGFEPVDAIGLTRESSTGVHGIDLSPDGTQLRMAIENDIIVYDLGLGAEITTVTGPDSADGVVNFVGAPPNTVGRYPLDCAC
jgi:hypothetical protein